MTTQTIETTETTQTIPTIPTIPGLTFRKFRGESDYPTMAAVIERSKRADQIEWTVTVEDIARNYTYLNNCDPYEDMLFAEVGGQVVGYSRVEWRQETEGDWIYFHFCHLLPEWRRKGIGRVVLRHNERRLREIAASHPPDGHHPKDGPHPANGARFFEAYASDTQPGAEALLRGEGYEPVRHSYEMVRPLSEEITVTPLPPGIEVHPASPEHYRAIWEADQEAFRDHWGYVPPTEKDYQRWLDDPDFNPDLWKIGWDGDKVAGMVLNFVNPRENAEYNRQRGYTEGISVRRPWRRRGLARALLTRSLHLFKDMGMTEAALGVDTENRSGALRLYESVGFRTVKRHSTYRKLMRET